VHRRDILGGLALSAPFLSRLVEPAAAQPAPPQEQPFNADTVRNIARDLATKPYRAADEELPGPLARIDYDHYRMIRFDPQKAIWRGDNLPFQMHLFHRGFIYRTRVDIHEVADGRARRLAYDPNLFSFGENERPQGDIGYAGFRLHHPINRPDYYDEVSAFLGASYFRAVGKGLGYGLSARGLAIKTAEPSGEEFPVFKAFWIERPRPGVNAILIHALLDSPSCAGAYRFAIRPGEDTVFDVQLQLFPREEIMAAGIGPLTSMYFFGPENRGGADDYRPAVHDSDGVMIATGRGEQLWRPLANPRELQVSGFGDANPRGFGLMQRRRDFAAYQDLEARYERRPSAWVEPIGDWGEGNVQLVEIPTRGEIHDNVVAFWRPKEMLRPRQEYGFVYRLHWLPAAPGNPELAQFLASRGGAAPENARLFVLDAVGGKLKDLPQNAEPQLDVSCGPGAIRNPVVFRNPETGGWRAHFEMVPGNARLVELRALLKQGDRPLTETWVYRWTR